jgi:hypothetical protein
MDGSFREPASGTQKHPKRFLVILITLLAGVIKWLAGLIRLTEEEQEDAGIYLNRPGGE